MQLCISIAETFIESIIAQKYKVAIVTNKFTDKNKIALSKALKKYGNPEGIQNIYELEGFLVGALCCPEMVNMDEMMSAIFGPEEDTYPEWDSEREVRTFFDSLFALQNKNNGRLRGASYTPKLLKGKKDHKNWCRGFLKGLGHEGIMAVDNLRHDENLTMITAILYVVAGLNVTDIVDGLGSDEVDVFSLALDKLTTKMLASSVQYLFLKLQKEDHSNCCEGDHHHHSHDGELLIH